MLYGFIKKHTAVLLSIVMGFALSVGFCAVTGAYSHRAMERLSSEVFRLHIVANSDNLNDQSLKLAVRDGILEKYRYFLSSSPSKAETVRFVSNHTDDIRLTAEKILSQAGCRLGVKAEVTKSSFPEKRYGEVVLPCGIYDCLKLTIGNAEGHNWWCVMFPPLCYTEGTCEEVEKYSNAIDKDTAELILADRKEAPPRIKVKLKIVELWQSRACRDRDDKAYGKSDRNISSEPDTRPQTA